jgi:hypothetical protein
VAASHTPGSVDCIGSHINNHSVQKGIRPGSVDCIGSVQLPVSFRSSSRALVQQFVYRRRTRASAARDACPAASLSCLCGPDESGASKRLPPLHI